LQVIDLAQIFGNLFYELIRLYFWDVRLGCASRQATRGITNRLFSQHENLGQIVRKWLKRLRFSSIYFMKKFDRFRPVTGGHGGSILAAPALPACHCIGPGEEVLAQRRARRTYRQIAQALEVARAPLTGCCARPDCTVWRSWSRQRRPTAKSTPRPARCCIWSCMSTF